jgi:zinc transporter ZupT
MKVFLYTLLANIFLGVWIIIVFSIIREFKKQISSKVSLITALTVGLLLALVFLGFLPEIFKGKLSNAWMYILIWIIVSYLIELVVHWHHCHEIDNGCNHDYHYKEHQNMILMFVSTLLHNMLHGIVLFAAFSSNIIFGIITTLSVFLHSIPQNIANYFMSLKNEKLAYVAAIWGVLWALFLFPFTDILLKNKAIVLSLIAWWLLYIALSDILPEWKSTQDLKWKLLYFVFVLLWIAIFILIKYLSFWIIHH